jgi:hypothetical protein
MRCKNRNVKIWEDCEILILKHETNWSSYIGREI